MAVRPVTFRLRFGSERDGRSPSTSDQRKKEIMDSTGTTLFAIGTIFFIIAGFAGSAWLFAWAIKCWVVRWLRREGWSKS